MSEEKQNQIIQGLIKAYWMEIETTQNFLAISVDLDGIRAEEIKKSLAADVLEELNHAQSLASRIKEIGGRIPGSLSFKPRQTFLQPPGESTDVVSAIRGVIAAEEEAIRQYNQVIQLCEGVDYVSQDLCIRLLADEEAHRRLFVGFLKEYEA